MGYRQPGPVTRGAGSSEGPRRASRARTTELARPAPLRAHRRPVLPVAMPPENGARAALPAGSSPAQGVASRVLGDLVAHWF